MESTSQRAVEEEVQSHAPHVAKAGGGGAPTLPMPEGLAQPQQALFEQMIACDTPYLSTI